MSEMFLIRANPKKIKFIKQLLEKNGLHVEETRLPEYIITVRKPNDYIPEDYKAFVEINKFNDAYSSILKNAGVLKDMTDASAQYKMGTPVKVVGGAYKDFTGIVVTADKKNCVVEISVWGKIVKETINSAELEEYETPFR